MQYARLMRRIVSALLGKNSWPDGRLDQSLLFSNTRHICICCRSKRCQSSNHGLLDSFNYVCSCKNPFQFASYAQGNTSWLQWMSVWVFLVFSLTFDCLFVNESAFLFDPDADNWRRKTVRVDDDGHDLSLSMLVKAIIIAMNGTWLMFECDTLILCFCFVIRRRLKGGTRGVSRCTKE